MTFIVEYPCQRCGAALEARSSEAYGWLRCPQCGRATLPPEHMRPRRFPDRGPRDEEVVIIGADPSDASMTEHLPFYPGSIRRIAFASTLFVALLVAVLSLLERERGVAMISTIIALGCLAFSVYPARPAR